MAAREELIILFDEMATALELLLDFIVQTELPKGLRVR